MSPAVQLAFWLAVMCLLLLATSIHKQVKLGSVTLQLLTWLGLAPNQIVMAVLVVVMVSTLPPACRESPT
jgi:ABC-type phosphate/phosphonate transport system permease subunit